MDTFGPGPDEITVPSADSCAARGEHGLCAPRSVHVIGFDGTLHDTLDISTVLSQGQDLYLGDLAWSPDGNRLAVSTEPAFGCERSSPPCEAKVWIFDRDGGEPRLVHTERANEYTALRDLAWSPDGDTLALLVASSGYCEAQGDAWPQLVALRVAPDEPVRAETLNVYDDWGVGVEGKGCVVQDDYHVAFPFAWSPDGTRIAVTRGGGIGEISTENGEVLARHAGEGSDGTLAWLAKR
jgi:dipeptidyl aminopeptidase/acylaminoacyl peptidase